ncbi:glycosyltransferase [Paenibacillus sp. FJAT-26967]|uniref:glycosyltransferase n=1 Tax=Paenibacillus sp. FJAT-26967 TaxID=1729690 RepID=UPI000838AD44|nr:glycosyltransferase [Paenibacillus sp. FJAT-26967]
MPPRVSIIIPFYNCAYVDQAIVSALSQTYPDKEIIVVDDGSTRHQDRITPYLPWIHYLGKSNGGTASALNHGIRHSSGDYIAWLSSDDRFYPHKLTAQIAGLSLSQATVGFTNYEVVDEHGRVMDAPNFPTDDGNTRHFTTSSKLYAYMLQYNPINGCTIVMHKELFRRYGLFDETFKYTQDLEMWLRLAAAGVRMEFLDEKLTQYRFHPAMGSRNHQQAAEQEVAVLRARYNPVIAARIAAMETEK